MKPHYQSKTCGDCIHRVKIIDQNNIGADNGECHRVPPNFSMVPTPQGMAGVCGYPQVPAKYPACGEFVGRAIELATRESDSAN